MLGLGQRGVQSGLAGGIALGIDNSALALAFAVMAWQADAGIHDHATGLVFVAIIMAGLAAGNLVAALAQRRDGDADRTPPQ